MIFTHVQSFHFPGGHQFQYSPAILANYWRRKGVANAINTRTNRLTARTLGAWSLRATLQRKSVLLGPKLETIGGVPRRCPHRAGLRWRGTRRQGLGGTSGPASQQDSQRSAVGLFLISAEMFLIPCVVVWAVLAIFSNIFLIPNSIRKSFWDYFVPDIIWNNFTTVPNMVISIVILCHALII